MAATGPAPSSSKQWWSRSSSSKTTSPASFRSDKPPLYAAAPAARPHTANVGRTQLMTSVTTPKTMSSNVFTTSNSKSNSSRFNLSAVLPSFASRSKKQSPLDIQDPPSQVRSLPTPKSYSSRQFAVPSPSSSSSSPSNPRLSRGVASSTSGNSRASTEGPLTPADELDPHASYPQSLMALTDLSDPFASYSPLNERRSSTHSDKSIGKRLMSKVESKSSKTMTRLPVGDGPRRKDSRDRSATLPSRARTATDASEAYLPLRAVEPPWQSSSSSPPESPDSPNSAVTSTHHATLDSGTSGMRTSPSSSSMLRKSKSSKPTFPWPEARPLAKSQGSRHRTNSSTSLSKEFLVEGSRASKSSSRASSVQPLPLSPTSLGRDTQDSFFPTDSAQHTPTPATTSFNLPPGPPPMQDLPPTPSSSCRFRVRAETMASASASAVSFASSLSSLSFTSRPSPQDPATPQAYPSLLAETLPNQDVRRGSDSGSSQASGSGSGRGHHGTLRSPTNEGAPKPPPKHTFPGSRPLPSPPVAPPPRERALSTASSTHSLRQDSISGSIRTLRKQRSFHNTSLQAPTPHPPILRHYNSFEPAIARSPPPPPPHDLPPLPPASPPAAKRTSPAKDALTSPRRKLLFSSHKHDRDRKPEPESRGDTPVTSPTTSASPPPTAAALHHSSWYDEANAEAFLSPVMPQHIVPPAELLRLGAAWERENESAHKARPAPQRLPAPPRSAGSGVPAPSWGVSKLPRSASLLSSKARSRDMSYAPAEPPAPPESYTSLSPPPRRVRPPAATTPTRRALSNAPTPEKARAGAGAGMGIGSPGGGARVERKPSFLDMTTTRRSVSIELPEQRDSFLELSRGMDSIDTIRESEASFQ